MINKLLVPCGALGTPYIHSFTERWLTEWYVGFGLLLLCAPKTWLFMAWARGSGGAFSIMYYTIVYMYINVVNFRQNLNGKALFMTRQFRLLRALARIVACCALRVIVDGKGIYSNLYVQLSIVYCCNYILLILLFVLTDPLDAWLMHVIGTIHSTINQFRLNSDQSFQHIYLFCL